MKSLFSRIGLASVLATFAIVVAIAVLGTLLFVAFGGLALAYSIAVLVFVAACREAWRRGSWSDAELKRREWEYRKEVEQFNKRELASVRNNHRASQHSGRERAS